MHVYIYIVKIARGIIWSACAAWSQHKFVMSSSRGVRSRRPLSLVGMCVWCVSESVSAVSVAKSITLITRLSVCRGAYCRRRRAADSYRSTKTSPTCDGRIWPPLSTDDDVISQQSWPPLPFCSVVIRRPSPWTSPRRQRLVEQRYY